jgi:protein-tyrosine kinase
MGKFYEALKRSGTFKEQGESKSPPRPVIQASMGELNQQQSDVTPSGRPVSRTLSHPDGVDPRLAAFLDPSSPPAESFKMLRTKLLVASRERELRTVMVTSAEPLDGKSLVSANLAVSIATGINEYVMLVDCDLRAPSIHRMFNVKTSRGIQEYLKEGTSLAPFLTKTSLKKLTLLPGSQPCSNPSELLCSQKMRLLVDELKSRYDDRFIIFDTPPGQFTAETAFLARLMDAVILVARYGKTPRELISETIGNIGRERIFGVVFNASHEREKDYRYYYRYYRGKGK